jgi:hypothetical protein
MSGSSNATSTADVLREIAEARETVEASRRVAIARAEAAHRQLAQASGDSDEALRGEIGLDQALAEIDQEHNAQLAELQQSWDRALAEAGAERQPPPTAEKEGRVEHVDVHVLPARPATSNDHGAPGPAGGPSSPDGGPNSAGS